MRNLSFLLSTIGKGGTRIWTRDLLICSQMLYYWAIPPIHPVKKLNKINYILHWKKHQLPFKVRILIIPKFQPIQKGHQDLNQGPLDLQSNALPLSHTPCSQKLRTKARKLHTWFWKHQTKTEVRNLSFLLSTIGKGGTRIWTRDLLICSRMLYYWAIPPIHPVKKLNKINYILHWKKHQLPFKVRILIIPKFQPIQKGDQDLNWGPLHV